MFQFGRNKNRDKSKNSSIQDQIDQKSADQIHVMPERFYVKPKPRRSGLTLIIIIGALALVVLALVALYLTKSFNQQPVPEPAANTDTGQITNQPPVNVEVAPVDQTPGVEATLPVEIAPPVEISIPTATTSTQEPAAPEQQELTIDQDGDGLTLAEEMLFGTDSNVADSDNDTFSDGAELTNGYDPLAANKTLLASGLFKPYSHQSYSINYPSAWIANDRSADQTETLFTSSSGEFVEVIVLPNPSSPVLADWYAQQFPEFRQANVVTVKINNTSGILHPNGLVYYLMKVDSPGKIFVVSYNNGQSAQLKYQTTFRAMVTSFKAL